MRFVRLTTLASVVALALQAGCSGIVPGQQQGDDQLAENRRITAGLERDWSSVRRVSRVEAEYVDDADNSPGVEVIAFCNGCSTTEVGAGMVGDIWTSRLSPLTSFTVEVFDESDSQSSNGYSETFVTANDAESLSRRYGERPAGTELE